MRQEQEHMSADTFFIACSAFLVMLYPVSYTRTSPSISEQVLFAHAGLQSSLSSCSSKLSFADHNNNILSYALTQITPSAFLHCREIGGRHRRHHCQLRQRRRRRVQSHTIAAAQASLKTSPARRRHSTWSVSSRRTVITWYQHHLVARNRFSLQSSARPPSFSAV